MSSKEEEEELKKKRRNEEIKKIIEEYEREKEIERQKEIESKVKEIEIENKNLIIIDNLYFLIINKNIIKDFKRPIVNIYSSTNENFSENNNKFSVYLSNSDLGCFRLCVELFNNYEKGNDYIQSSFIHIELQEYIHKIFEKLEPSEDHFCSIIESETHGKNGQKLYDHIYEKERQIIKTPFIEYNINACGDDNSLLSSDVNEKLNNFSEKLKSLYDFSNDFSNNKPICKVNINDSINIYYLEFYKVKLKLKEQEQEDNIILYYCNAKITKFMNKTSESFPIYINLPVFLTTTEGDKITKFGTFEKYILAGNYICKVFDYINQCPKDHTGECFGKYKLIGDKYNNIFPLLEIREEQAREQAREQAKELSGGVIQMINDRCDINIKNINDSNCNQKILKLQNIYNVRKQLIEDTERFFNKKIKLVTK
jgi:hypothetical protein